MRGRLWTPYDDRRLREELLAGVPVAEVAVHLGRTPPAILSRASTLRIHLLGSRPIQRPLDHLRKTNAHRITTTNGASQGIETQSAAIAELSELIATLLATARNLPPGAERQAALKQIGSFQAQLDTLAVRK